MKRNKNINYIIIFSIIVILICLISCLFFKKRYNNIKNIAEENVIVQEPNIENQDFVEIEKVIESYTTMYAATAGLNVRKEPSLNSEIVKILDINAEVQKVDNFDNNEWTKIKIDNNYYYIVSKFLSILPIGISQESVTINTYNNINNTGVLTKSKGVNYFNGHRETWYSQRVLPGGGLHIPGRHVDDRGLVCDEDGYICVASEDYPKGTIIETSLGMGKVYDCGCDNGTIDIYTDW